jgi:preprotein translocase SecE subunit
VRRAIEEKRETTNAAGEFTPDVLSKEQLSKLAELRRQSKQLPEPSSNPIQGALDEAQLITWPSPQKALLDTVLVLAIVSASGALLLGVNILLADLSTAWYSS